MSRFRKLYEKVRANPHQVRFEELRTLLMRAGFAERNPGTSHYTYKKGRKIITLPRRKPFILEVYVKLVLEALEGELPDE